MAIDVTVTNTCARCKRKEQLAISSDQIADFEDRQRALQANAKRVQELVVEMQEQGGLPDLIVVFRGEVRILPQVCEAHCDKPVKNGISSLFLDKKSNEAPKKRGRKKKNAASSDATASAAE